MDAGVKTKKPGAPVERARKGSEPGAKPPSSRSASSAPARWATASPMWSRWPATTSRINDLKKEAVDKARATIERNMARQVSRGIITDAEMQAALKRIRIAPDLRRHRRGRPRHRGGHRGRGGQAQDLHRPLSASCKKSAMLATNTSSISITRLASVTDRPERFIGMHFMNPVPMMQLVELIRGIATEDETFGLASELHREPRQEHRRLGGLPGLHRQPHPAADDQRGGLHAL